MFELSLIGEQVYGRLINTKFNLKSTEQNTSNIALNDLNRQI